MAGVEQFKDLIAWQKARDLTREVYRLTRQSQFARDLGLASQIQRASVSSMSNVAEGFERARPKEFHQALSTAKASAAEVRSLAYVALDAGYLTADTFRALHAAATEAGRVIGGLRSSVERRLATARPGRPRAKALSTQHSALSTRT